MTDDEDDDTRVTLPPGALKRCPCCGHEAKVRAWEIIARPLSEGDEWRGGIYAEMSEDGYCCDIHCEDEENCGVVISLCADTKDEAVALVATAWNKRTP